MSSFNDPNREAVGLEPIWTGAGEKPRKAKASDTPPEPEKPPTEPEPTPAEDKSTPTPRKRSS